MIDALHHLALIAELGSFTRAARRAHVSQPALTASIQRLERSFGARLLDRGRFGARLTAAGAVVLPAARAARAALDDARRAVAELEGLERGVVRLAAGATACTYFLPPVLAAFRAKHPGVRLQLREDTTGVVREDVERGELDLGIVTDARSELWFDDELVLVAAPALAKRGAAAPFVTFGRGATTRQMLEQAFPAAEIAMELGSIAAIKGHVRAGIGIALVSRAAVVGDLASGRLVEIPHEATPMIRPLNLVHRGVAQLPPAAAALRRMLLERRPSPAARPPARRKKPSSRRRAPR